MLCQLNNDGTAIKTTPLNQLSHQEVLGRWAESIIYGILPMQTVRGTILMQQATGAGKTADFIILM